jgi:hypothetical protein
MVLVLQAGLLAATFFTGRYWSVRLADRAVESPEKPASAAQADPSSTSSPNLSSNLTEAKADLAKILRLHGSDDREKALLSLAAGLDNATLKGLLADLEPHLKSGNNKQAISILLGQLAESDPQAALDSLKGIRNAYAYGAGLVSSIFDAWSAKDPASALAAIAQLPISTDYEKNAFGIDPRGDALQAVIENMMAQDPQAALSALGSQHFGAYSVGTISYLYGEVASVNPSAAAAAALNLPLSSVRNAVMASVAGYWAAQDPAGALAWANGLPAGQAKNDAVQSVIETMDEQDPSAAATYLLQLPSSSSREAMLNDVTYNWANADPAGMLTWASQNLTGSDYNTAIGNALNCMGQTDPAAEVAALAQISDPQVVNAAIPRLAWNWAEVDVQSALAWAQALPADNAQVRNAALSDVFNVWTVNDPVSAAAYVQTLTTDASFGNLANQVLNSWGRSDPQAALAWVESLPPGPAQNQAMETALAQLANVNPQAALDAAGQLTGGTKDNAQTNIFDTWSAGQPAEAAAALMNTNDTYFNGTTLNTVTATVARNWLNQDPQAATQWINTLPPGAPRDNAVEQIVSTVGPSDPASAFAWALSIGSQSARNTQVVNLATQWSNQNPTAAAAAAQNALNNLTGVSDAQTIALQKVAAQAPAH